MNKFCPECGLPAPQVEMQIVAPDGYGIRRRWIVKKSTAVDYEAKTGEFYVSHDGIVRSVSGTVLVRYATRIVVPADEVGTS